MSNREISPWRYLEILVNADRGPEHDSRWMTERMKVFYQGNYHIELVAHEFDEYMDYEIVFDDPADETYWRLKYPNDHGRN